MGDVVSTFGRVVERLAVKNPVAGRRLFLMGLQAFGLKLSYFPDRRLPASKRYLAKTMNLIMRRLLSQSGTSALVSIFQPCELLEAMDVVPMCAELFAGFLSGSNAEEVFADAAEAEGVADTFCSYHKVLLGSALTGFLPPPSVIVNTSLVCDANDLTFRALSEQYGAPQYYVDVPPGRNQENIDYVADQFRDLKVFLEDNLHRALDETKLREVMARSQCTVKLLRQSIAERRDRYLPGDLTSEMYEIYMTHNALGTKEAERYAEMMLADLKAAPQTRGLRILWIHTMPFWQEPVRAMFDLNDRCHVVACDISLESLTDIDPDKPYESMAKRLVLSPWNDADLRLTTTLSLARVLDADGVIVFCHWGCKQTLGFSGLLRDTLEQEGFPTLLINGDGCDRRNVSDGQTATRLNAFIEMLEGGRHG